MRPQTLIIVYAPLANMEPLPPVTIAISPSFTASYVILPLVVWSVMQA